MRNPILCSVILNLTLLSSVLADLLCRNCGHRITTADALKNVKSPTALDRYNMTVLGKETMVQVFQNPVPETFHLVAADGADLKFAGASSEADTWYPGMRWTACICSKCASHMGWYFESSQNPKVNHVGLVLDYLISSDYVDTLTLAPRP